LCALHCPPEMRRLRFRLGEKAARRRVFSAFFAQKAAVEKQIFKIQNFLLTNAAGVDRISAITYFQRFDRDQ
ncbi:MAG TPA: hypothetical protein PLP20_02825, partial [Oscillospiraceae bacterium]|nr:hypothetical protein [Oscillospiraceae bacterium]